MLAALVCACTDGGDKVVDCVEGENSLESDTRLPPCTDGRRWDRSGGSESYCFAYANHACEEHPVSPPMRLAAYSFAQDRGYPPVSTAEVESAFQHAVDEVNALSSGTGAVYSFAYSPSEDVEPEEGFRVARDGVSMVGMGGLRFTSFPLVGEELARTTCNLDEAFEYGDCDISLRPYISLRFGAGAGDIDRQVIWIPWSYQLPGPDEYHIQSAMAHELGHVLGLAHSPATGLLANLQSGEILEPTCDERRALYFLYCPSSSEAQLCDDAEIAAWTCPT